MISKYCFNKFVQENTKYYYFFRWNLRSSYKHKLGFAASKTVSKSTAHHFKNLTDAKMKELKENSLKIRTFAKFQWAVRAFKEWCNVKLADPTTYDYRIYLSDLDNVAKLNKDSFQFVMCHFISDVTKVKDGSDYPGRTLYQMYVSILKHLNHNGLNWKLVEGSNFT